MYGVGGLKAQEWVYICPSEKCQRTRLVANCLGLKRFYVEEKKKSLFKDFLWIILLYLFWGTAVIVAITFIPQNLPLCLWTIYRYISSIQRMWDRNGKLW